MMAAATQLPIVPALPTMGVTVGAADVVVGLIAWLWATRPKRSS